MSERRGSVLAKEYSIICRVQKVLRPSIAAMTAP
jgi:hypothetical protein